MNPWVNEYNLEPDSLLPQKRPMSLSCPTIMLDKHDKVKMVIGAAGGRTIASALAQVGFVVLKVYPAGHLGSILCRIHNI